MAGVCSRAPTPSAEADGVEGDTWTADRAWAMSADRLPRAAGFGSPLCRAWRMALVADDARKPQLEAAEQEGEPPDRPGDADRSVTGVDDEEHAEQHQEGAAERDGPCVRRPACGP